METDRSANSTYAIPQAPAISLPKGGGAIKNIGEKFQANPLTGTASFEVPIKLSPGRNEFGPQLSVSYDSGQGNGPFGLGWGLGIPSVVRKTQKGIPQYQDSFESDTFMLSGFEDLVPMLSKNEDWAPVEEKHGTYLIKRYCPRIEESFARIEKWTDLESTRSHWRITTRDNLTSIYGRSETAQISDPNDPGKVFEWLLEKTYDDKGNGMIYEYKPENLQNVPNQPSEQHRLKGLSSLSNRYLKRIYYGNTRPVNRLNGELDNDNQWLFEAILDYGEHGDMPSYEEQAQWRCRMDPQSSYRAGFEIRTYRLCQRILMYHHFEELGDEPYLVASTNFDHQETKTASFLKAVQYWAYEKGKDAAPFPPVSFKYSERTIGTAETVDINLTDKYGLTIDPARVSWMDLKNEGIPGLLYRDPKAWWYKRNTTMQSPQFESFKKEFEIPSVHQTQETTSELVDFDGDGMTELVVRSPGLSGFFEKENTSWSNFRAFENDPSINWQDPNLRMIDLTGDGLADILISGDQCFTWYAGKSRDGYDKARKVQKQLDESQGPDLVFSDSTQSIYLSDLSGDGLTDVVRIRNGQVSYWPNLGYGHFGPQVVMNNAPRFESEDSFNQNRLRLADIDGSGTTDLVYIYSDKIVYWINESGNGFSHPITLALDLQLDDLSQVQVTDIYGKGTSCLVISHPSSSQKRNLQTIDLMKNGKPYLLKEVNNNMGALTRFQYCSSSKFYLEAEKKGKPWVTKLPFPVQVLEKTEVIGEIENNRFTTRYAYHHGYYDGIEREFRGFGLVEQWDTETYEEHLKWDGDRIEEELYVPPTHTKTWFHTGFLKNKNAILGQYQSEYYQGDPDAWALRDIEFPDHWEPEEYREAARALKGSMLRQEVYALDGTELEAHPYTVAQSNYQLRRIQPKKKNQFTVFDALPAEKLTYHYERNPADPRISHEVTLQTDEFGNELITAAIGYPRRVSQYDEQAKHGIAITQNDVINKPNESDYYRLGISYQTRSYELTGLSFEGNKFGSGDILEQFNQAIGIPYEQEANLSKVEKRLLGHQKVTFYAEDLNSDLPPGEVAFHTMPYKSYQLAFTAGLLEKVYGEKATTDMLEEIGYLRENNDWWAPSGFVQFDAEHFFQIKETSDHLGNRSQIAYDTYALLPVRTINALSSETTADYDYRVLQSKLMTDANRNQQAVTFDVRGSVIASAVIGKYGEGDSLEDPTVKMEYELFNWVNHRRPNYSKTMARERHQDPNTPWQTTFTYTNGTGKEILTKAQAEDGKAFVRNADGSLKKDASGALVREHTNDRWIGNGRTVLNNKGKPVKAYEPYFSNTPDYEDEAEVREYGVTPVNLYDPLERVIRTDLPDGTFTKVEFDPWKKVGWDQNDLVLGSDWYLQRGAPDPSESVPSDAQQRAAWLAARHADTPETTHLDYLGRDFLVIEDNGSEGQYATQTVLDIEGNPKNITDPKGRELARYQSDAMGRQIYSRSADAGERWTLPCLYVEEAEEEGDEDRPLPAYTWDSREFRRRIAYDALERPHQEWISEAGGNEKLVEWRVFGEGMPDAETKNLIGQEYLQLDQAGLAKSEVFDFKGNPLSGILIFAKAYKRTIDWSAYADVDIAQLESATEAELEDERFHSSSEFDALNRAITTTHPDQSVIKPGYNKANLLEKVSARIRGSQVWTDFVTNIDYDEKGQRQAIYYANGTKTNYAYDPLNYRLTRLFTVRQDDNIFLQDLYYYYDPVGNITEIKDEAQQTVFFNNTQVNPSGKYEYDALYRLRQATGRELAGLAQTTSEDIPIQPIRNQNDANALRNYLQTFQYDELGNILIMKHQADGGNWTRHYRYEENSNRLLETSGPGDNKNDAYSDQYVHDVHGNMTQMPHLQTIEWDHNDQMKTVDLGGGGQAYYVYDSSGQRVRKVIERKGGKKQERLYLGEVEMYRESQGDTLQLERETLHLSDDETRIAQVESLTIEGQQPTANSQPLARYQYSNHLGSASLELDENARIISYEEYYPFGTSSYRSGRSTSEVSLKRYRYSGKERDEETGLYYYGARSLIPWLGRWCSADPAGFVDGLNVFGFVAQNPLSFLDSKGMARRPTRRSNSRNNHNYQLYNLIHVRGRRQKPSQTLVNQLNNIWNPGGQGSGGNGRPNNPWPNQGGPTFADYLKVVHHYQRKAKTNVGDILRFRVGAAKAIKDSLTKIQDNIKAMRSLRRFSSYYNPIWAGKVERRLIDRYSKLKNIKKLSMESIQRDIQAFHIRHELVDPNKPRILREGKYLSESDQANILRNITLYLADEGARRILEKIAPRKYKIEVERRQKEWNDILSGKKTLNYYYPIKLQKTWFDMLNEHVESTNKK